jgi:hypothetical protein
MGEAVANIAQLALLHILLDGIEWQIFADLRRQSSQLPNSGLTIAALETNLQFSVRPPRNLHNHIQNGAFLVRVQGNVMERRDDSLSLAF